jgi:hypothetical protein
MPDTAPSEPGSRSQTDAAPQTRAHVNAEIRSIAGMAGLDQAWIDRQIDAEATTDQARAAAFEAMRQRGTETPMTHRVELVTDNEDPQVRAQRIGEALYTRVNPSHTPSDPARPYMGLTLPEIGRTVLRAHGVGTTGMAASTVITRALHTTSDFSLILAHTVNRTLRQAYEAAPAGVRRLGRMTTARDFRAKHRLQLGEAPTLEKVGEHGEFKSGTMAEAEETYAVETFGRIIGISRQALVNDDLGAFTDLSRRFGQAAAEFEAQQLVDLLTRNSGAGPAMSDGHNLFDTSNHGNAAGSGAALSQTTLSAARLAMRKQTGLSGKPINVRPAYLLVPPDLETTAEQVLANIQPNKTSDVNVFGGALSLVVEARLTDPDRWYVVAEPGEVDGLEYAYLDGAQGPQIESRNGFEVDGVEIRVREDFGAGFVDWRSWYTNAGA